MIDALRTKLLSQNKNNFPSGARVGCFAVLGKQVYTGNNSKKSHPKMMKRYPSGNESHCTHAEVSALNKVPRQCRHQVIMYVMRFLCDGIMSMARPCALCEIFLKNNGVRTIYFTNWVGAWERMRLT